MTQMRFIEEDTVQIPMKEYPVHVDATRTAALLVRHPTPETIQDFLEKQAQLDLTYSGVGETVGTAPSGYIVDHTRVRLGSGEEVFASARLALEDWQQFQLGWLAPWPANTPIREGSVIVLVARSLGLWWLNACRIVYVIEEDHDAKRFGFAYGTLPAHAGSGEERFMIETDDEGTVWYDIRAFSCPQGPLSYIGYPYLRYVQKRFAKDSAAVMQDSVKSALALAIAR